MSNNILQEYSTILEQTKSSLPIAPYDWHALSKTLPGEWLAYSQFLSEHAGQLANVINDLRRYIKSLSAWNKVLETMNEEQEKYNIVTEYVSPLATLTLNMPYIIRSRFVYSIAHLSHQANKLKQASWIDDLPIDNKIYFEEADKYSKPWKKYKKLKLALEKIANKEYDKSTHYFRNKYNHRYSSNIEVGLTGFVTRTVNKEGRVSYGFGYTDPLMLKDIIPLLENQCSLCISAFSRYQDLVHEQTLEINNTLP